MANAFLLRPLPMASISVTAVPTSGIATNLANDYAGITCRFACDLGGNVGAVVVDLGADRQVDTVMVFGLTALPDSATAAVIFATAAAPSSFTAVAFGPAYAGSVPRTSGAGVLLLTFPTVTGRYFNVNFSAGAAGQFVEASRVVIGQRFQPAINFEYGGQFGVRDLGSMDVSARGVLLRHRGKKLRTASINFPALNKQEAESFAQKMLEQVGNTECIALCTDPTPDPERQNRCYFGPLVGDLGRTWATAGGHKVPINLLGIM